MAKIDVVKEKINYLKVWLGIFVVTLIGLVGWLSSKFEAISDERLAISIHFLNKNILKKINSLEGL